jgi:hypothetical protein
MNKKTKRLALTVFVALCGTATMANAAGVTDDKVANLNFNTQGIKDVFYAKNGPAKTILHHIQAFASKDTDALVLDYRNSSTFTFGPYSSGSSGNTYEAAGKTRIKDTFGFLFTGGLPPFTVMTVTSASHIGSQFYQTFDLNNGCIGSDTFVVVGKKITRQTVYVVCK